MFIGSLVIKGKRDIIHSRNRVKKLCSELKIRHLDTIKLMTAISEISRVMYDAFQDIKINFSIENIFDKYGLKIGFLNAKSPINTNKNIEKVELPQIQNLVDEIKKKISKKKLNIEILQYLSIARSDLEEIMNNVQNMFSDISEESAYLALKSQNQEIISLYQQIKEKNKELKEKNEKLEKVLMELEFNNKKIRKTLDQFAYAASHDFKEPLRMITNFTQLLELKYKDLLDEKGRTYIQYAIEGADRMNQIIDDLLIYSKIDYNDQSESLIDLNEVIDEVISDLMVLIRKNKAEVTYEDLPKLKTNKSQLNQLFSNLIGNAIKFRRKVPPKIHISVKEKNNKYLFSIEDNGKGIEPEYFDQIFILFQRLNDRQEYGGNGIGLAMCKKIIEGHGGKIWVDSKPNIGSTFYFTIPKD
ncbi:MAG: sensor histidine kinase [Promethearchaeia archaeon]